AAPPAARAVVTPILVLLVSSWAASLAFNQPYSMYRYFVFTTPLLSLLCVVAWYCAFAFLFGKYLRSGWVKAMAVVIGCAAVFNMIGIAGFPRYPRQKLDFLLGRRSFHE